MFKNQFPEFKPEFGNERHIWILEKMKKYYQARNQYEDILKARKQSAQMRAKCKSLKDEVRKMINFEKNKTGK